MAFFGTHSVLKVLQCRHTGRVLFFSMLFFSLCLFIFFFGNQKVLRIKTSNNLGIRKLPDAYLEACTPVPKDLPNWMAFHKSLAQEALERSQNSEDPVNLLFLGDSITEFLRGTNIGHPNHRLVPTQAVWNEDIAPLGALALGVSGDCTQHLLWRLQNGELPEQLKPKVVVVHIGTNNLGHSLGNDDDIASGIRKIVEYITETLPQTEVLILGLLPRYGPRHESGNEDIRQRILAINSQSELYAQSTAGRVSFLDCSDVFLLHHLEEAVDDNAAGQYPDPNKETRGKGFQIDQVLMKDFLHPTAKGYHKLFTTCLLPYLQKRANLG